MLTEQERADLARKAKEAKERAEQLAELDAVAAKIAADNNPCVGRITVRSPDGTVKHVYTPPAKAAPTQPTITTGDITDANI